MTLRKISSKDSQPWAGVLKTEESSLSALSVPLLPKPLYPVNPFVVPAKAQRVAKVQVAQPKAPVGLLLGQPNQPISDHGIVARELGLVAVTGLADADRRASHPNADVTLGHRRFGNLP